MEKMYAIGDDASGQFVEDRIYALRLDDQWASIDFLEAGRDFAA
jgi:hypothetical protein